MIFMFVFNSYQHRQIEESERVIDAKIARVEEKVHNLETRVDGLDMKLDIIVSHWHNR
jgi:tetrahydromethanopterin S-methyltransferase subunit B